ncbi:MAG: PAS domain-containing sensor histidine kinase [Promethearchaeota archaeon]|jgi:PAS domain S-box-containing protein
MDADFPKLKEFHDIVSLSEISQDAIFIIFDEIIIFANNIAAEMLGFNDASQILGRWSCEFFSPESKQVYYKPSGKSTPYRYEIKSRKKDGSTFDVEAQISIIEHEGRPASLIFVRDISERKIFERNLNAIHMHSIELNSIDSIEEISKSTLKLMLKNLRYQNAGFGVVKEDNIYFKRSMGNRFNQILHLGELNSKVMAVKTGETQLIEQANNGGSINISEICVPIKVDEQVFGVLVIDNENAIAFSEYDKEILEMLSENIASSVTIINQKEKLKQNLHELELKNRELDEYTYAVSHDLRAPCRSIRAYIGFLLEEFDELEDKQKEYLDRISDATSRMQNLIEDLLLLSRINRKFTEIEPIDLNEIVREIEIDYDSIINEKGAVIEYEKLPVINTQKVWIRQLLSNLISNGIKFNKSTNPKVIIKYEEHYDHHQFSVKDNGIGIDKENFLRIFKLFQRLHTEEEFPGTGAGLTISRKIIESLGGKIWLESEKGLGSTFFITLPKDRNNREKEKTTQLTEHEVQPAHTIEIDMSPRVMEIE